MDQPASLRVKNRRILPDVVDYQLQHKNGMNLKVQPSHQSNGKTYINVFATVKEDCEYKSKNYSAAAEENCEFCLWENALKQRFEKSCHT